MGATTDSTIVAINLGSKTVHILVGEVDENGAVACVGAAVEPSAGLRHGGLVDLEAAKAALVNALNKAEAESGRRIDSAYVSLGGLYLQARNLHGAASILPAGREVQSEDIAHAIAAARAAIADDEPRDLIHLIPRSYTLDGQDGVHNPLGMIGRELWVEAHTVTGASSHIANLVKLLREARVEPEDLVSGPLAAAEGVIQAYLDESSPLVIDLGAETLSLALYDDGAIRHSEILPFGGDDLTRDIAHELRLPVEAAEAVKRRFGTCYPNTVAEDELVELLPLTQSDELLPRRLLAEIIYSRANVMAQAIAERVRDAEAEGIRPSVLVLVGGGAELGGLSSLFEEILRTPVVIGRPHGVTGLQAHLAQPELASAAGLLIWGARQRQRQIPLQRGSGRGALLPHLMAGARRLIPGFLA